MNCVSEVMAGELCQWVVGGAGRSERYRHETHEENCVSEVMAGELCQWVVGGAGRSERYRHETHEENADSDDDADDSMFHSFSSCSPRYSHDQTRLDRVRVSTPPRSTSIIFIRRAQICIECSRFITCQSNTSKGRGHDRLPN